MTASRFRSLQPGFLAAGILLSTALSSGCSSSAALRFRCDRQINGGLLLTVDVVRATEDQAKQIQALGERWFYDPLRDSLRDRTTTVTFPSGGSVEDCRREVKISSDKKAKYLVIVADYKYQNPDPTKHLVSLSRDRWKGKTLEIAVHDRELSVESR
jgi:hypothetical protein